MCSLAYMLKREVKDDDVAMYVVDSMLLCPVCDVYVLIDSKQLFTVGILSRCPTATYQYQRLIRYGEYLVLDSNYPRLLEFCRTLTISLSVFAHGTRTSHKSHVRHYGGYHRPS